MEKFNLYEYYRHMTGENILLSFKGALSQEILVEMGQLIKNHLTFDKKIKKIFSVFVELAQNIMHYSAEQELVDDKKIGVGVLVFTESTEFYTVYSGNLIENKYYDKLKNKIDKVNSLDTDKLKEFYFEQRRKDTEKDSKGAGLGFIEIARKSGEKIEYDINNLNEDKSFLSLAVRIRKTINKTEK